MRSRLSRVAATVLVTVAALAWLPPAAQAAETPTLRLEPWPRQIQGRERSSFRFDVPPGGRTTASVRVTNKTDEPRTVRLYGADAHPDPETGSLMAEPVGAPTDGVGAWISVERAEVTLLPRSSATVGFAVARPADTRAAGVGAIVAEEVRENSDGAGIEVVFRLALLVRLGGDTGGLAVEDTSISVPISLLPNEALVRTVVENRSLDPITTTVRFRVEGVTGSVWRLDPTEVELAPGERQEVRQVWENVPRWGGLLQPTAEVTWEGAVVEAPGPRRFIIPLWLLALVILVVGIRVVRELRTQPRRWRERRRIRGQVADLGQELIGVELALRQAAPTFTPEVTADLVARARDIAGHADDLAVRGQVEASRVARAARALATTIEARGREPRVARAAADEYDAWLASLTSDGRSPRATIGAGSGSGGAE